MYLTVFEVTGLESSHFPFDMLRYDHCYPTRGDDAGALTPPRDSSGPAKRTIRLSATSTNPAWGPAFRRWAAEGWGVSKVEPTREVE